MASALVEQWQVERWPIEDRIGQLFMVGMSTDGVVDGAYRRLLTDTRTGNVVLLGTSTAGVEGAKQLTDELREAAPTVDGVRLLVAADQEGGAVQRLKGPGFDTVPSATEQGKMPPAELQEAAATWGAQLRAAGVDADLAPVADAVPADKVDVNEPIGRLRRHFGETPKEVTPQMGAFVRGMRAAQVATSLKHFPGLGHVTGNTDLTGDVVDDVVDAQDEGLAVFGSGIAAGADMVMVSTAIYAMIDPRNSATFSADVVDLLRADLGFGGVVISDDLGAARQVAGIPPGDRALRFLLAGGDLVINADPALQRTMVTAVQERAEADERFADEITIKATRVVAMKARHGAARHIYPSTRRSAMAARAGASHWGAVLRGMEA